MSKTHAHPEHEAPHADEHGEHGHDKFHLVPVKYLVVTGMALLVLTIITVTASFIDFNAIDLPELNIMVALAIAVVKASLVCLFFMHLRWDRPFNSFVLVASIAFVALFIGFAMTDQVEYGPDVREYRLSGLQNKEPMQIQSKIDESRAGLAVSEAPPQPPTSAAPLGASAPSEE